MAMMIEELHGREVSRKCRGMMHDVRLLDEDLNGACGRADARGVLSIWRAVVVKLVLGLSVV